MRWMKSVSAAALLFAAFCNTPQSPDVDSIIIQSMTPAAESRIADTDTVVIEYLLDFKTQIDSVVIFLSSFCGPLRSTFAAIDTISTAATQGVLKYTYQGISLKCGVLDSASGARIYRNQLWVDLNGNAIDDEGIRSKSYLFHVMETATAP